MQFHSVVSVCDTLFSVMVEMDKALFVFVLSLSGLSIIASRPDVDESVTGKAGLLHRVILDIYDRSIGLLLTPHTPEKSEELETEKRLTNEYAKISAIALAEYYGTIILKRQCNEEPPTVIPAEKLRLIRLICEENDKRFKPNVEEKVYPGLAKVMLREMLKKFSIAEMKEGCKTIESFNLLNVPELDRVWIERVCVEAIKQ